MIRRIISILFFIFLLFMIAMVSAWVGNKIVKEPSYALFSYGSYSIETSLWIALGVFLLGSGVVVIALQLILSFLRLFRQHTTYDRKATQLLSRGLVYLAEGRFKQAEKVFLAAAKLTHNAFICYYGAAKAAQEQGKPDFSDNYLRKAKDSRPLIPGKSIAIGVTRAQLHFDSNQYEQCLATLLALKKKAPNHLSILKLLRDVCLKLKEWQRLKDLLPLLEKSKVGSDQSRKTLSIQVYSEILMTNLLRIQAKTSDKNQKLDLLRQEWKSIPIRLRREEALIKNYADLLKKIEAHDEAASEVQDAIKKNWNSELVQLYGSLSCSQVEKQLQQLISWNNKHPDDAALLLALGRLSLKNKDHDKAVQYLEESHRLKSSSETCRELGLLYQQMGNFERSAWYYHQGLNLALGVKTDTNLNALNQNSMQTSKQTAH